MGPAIQPVRQVEAGRLAASGIGRVAKAGKEEIVGLITALQLYLAERR